MTDDLLGSTDELEFHGFEVSDRDRGAFLIDDIDLDAQLLAIAGVLRRNNQAEETVGKEIKELDAFIHSYEGGDEEYEMHLSDDWVDRMHGTVFQDAAHSMSAVGMLAPFIESLFVAIFKALQLRSDTKKLIAKGVRTAASPDDFWDPHFVYSQAGRHKDIAAGIVQLAASTGLAAFLPQDYEKLLSALFSYRNKMFHHGFEWPVTERSKFAKRIVDETWPANWFKKSESNDLPWIFYLSDTLIEACLKMIEQTLSGVGRYITENKIQIGV